MGADPAPAAKQAIARDQGRQPASRRASRSCSRRWLYFGAVRQGARAGYQLVERRRLDPLGSARSTTSASTASRCRWSGSRRCSLFIAVPASFNIEKARQGLLRAPAPARDRHARRLRRARLLPVLRVLGSDAAADVLPDRRLGRAAAGVRGDQVLPVHAGRHGADADRDRRAAHSTAARFAIPRPDRARAQPGSSPARTCPTAAMLLGMQLHDLGLLVPVHRLRDQGAGLPVPHLAARRPRRGADADLHDPGRRPAEAGRLRHPPHLLSDLPDGGHDVRLRARRPRRGQHRLRRLRAMAQTDFKRLVAYSSVSHMGYVLLGIARR